MDAMLCVVAVIKLRNDSETTAVGPGLVIESPLQVEEEDVHGYDVELVVAAQGGRLVAKQVTVSQREGGPPVTVEGIRNLPIAGLTRVAASQLSEVEKRSEGVYEITKREVDRKRIRQAVSDGPTDSTLELVAYIYRYANAIGEPPAKTVENTFELSRSKTGRWIALARERGFLGPSEGPGKAAG